ncbi:MAG: TetR/AcrR family transcriptional regulator [Solirubrobacteraceae bacterium]|nr:TetR/AcrR family transcriptional regulator [Solirubrobacteraceae bacterium]
MSDPSPVVPNRRPPAGAAIQRESVTTAIRDAVLIELAEHGYGRTSVEAVARRAGVGKAAIYRRWPAKLDLVMAAVSDAAVRPGDIADTGTLRGDVLSFLRAGRALLGHSLGRRIVPDLLAEAIRTPALAELMDRSIGSPRRELAASLIERAIDRGELRAGLDLELALDIVPGALYWRLSVRRAEAPDADLERMADAVVAALHTL